MSYGWIITADHIAEQGEAKDVDVIGPSNVTQDITMRLLRGEGEPFRLYDDDGKLYYEGRIVYNLCSR